MTMRVYRFRPETELVYRGTQRDIIARVWRDAEDHYRVSAMGIEERDPHCVTVYVMIRGWRSWFACTRRRVAASLLFSVLAAMPAHVFAKVRVIRDRG
jgi:hypothetical protein